MDYPNRVAFTIPKINFPIYWYAICITLGIVAAVIIATVNAKKRRMPADTAVDLCLLAVPLGIIFARLYYVLFNLSEFKTFTDIINIRSGGLAIPGGLIGGIVGICLNSLIKKKRVWGYFDIVVPGVALAQAIGRWGNYFNQEAYGEAISNPSFLYFPLTVKIENCGCTMAARHGHMATFFYESVSCFLIFIILMLLTSKKKMKHTGDIFLLYLLMYSFERAIIEQFRMDSLMLGNIRVTQALCAVLFVVVALIFIIRAAYEKKKGVVLCAIDYDEYYVPSKNEAVSENKPDADSDDENADDDVDDEDDGIDKSEAVNLTETEETDSSAEVSKGDEPASDDR